MPVKTLADVIKSGGFHPSAQRRLEQADQGPENGPDSPACKADAAYRDQVRESVIEDDGQAQARRVRLSRPGAIRRA